MSTLNITTTVPAAPAILMHNYENGAVVSTSVIKKPGAVSRTSGFWPGTWLGDDGRLFFVMETGVVIQAETPAALVKKSLEYRKTLKLAA